MPDLSRLEPDLGLLDPPTFDEEEVLARAGTMLETSRPQTWVGRDAGGADGRAG